MKNEENIYKKILSVSVAGYNIEPFIDDTVGSVIESDAIDEIEIIIVNDGSKDGTSKKAHELQNRYPDSVIVVDKENGGYGSTINTSVKRATGKYYRLLDGDDWYNTSALADYIEFLKTCEADIVITPYYRVNDTTGEKTLYDHHNTICREKNYINKTLVQDPGFVMHEIAIRTDVYKSIDKEITEKCFYTDVEFTCNSFIASETMARFEKPIYCYRVGVEGQSVSVKGLRAHYKDHPKVIEQVFSTYEAYKDTIKGVKKNVIDYWITVLTRNAYVSYLLLEDPCKYRNELIRVDNTIKKNHPDLYAIGNRSKLVNVLRKTKFRPYLLWSTIVTRKYNNQ